MPKRAPNFFTVARQPKWIGALLLSLGVAAIFALLGQWQLDRTFTKDLPAVTAQNLDSVSVTIDTQNVYIVANRLHKGELGYWLVANSTDEAGRSQTLALGWSANLDELKAERQAIRTSMVAQQLVTFEGVLIPTEAPQRQTREENYIFDSLSLAQLVNFYSPDEPIESNPQILAFTGHSQASAWPPLQSIEVTYEQGQQINWLSAFYFLEWIVFAGFAMFLWWRLVRDEQIRLGSEPVN
ncbi:SURF1 family cytochrome oxidase biogenesis protein [Rhodoluna limnophila]|uniref:SURF1 family cytochrome oxidase biogenesis protein n=1 Tax=Rhodoluna limnophila TaxID=232537 RepID=UPI001105E02C|nr:SURF1 family cytochrome oxidase biogenesis protein [Rhodoluna limnophila]